MKRLTKRTAAGAANIDYDGCTFPNGEEDYIAKSARRQLAIECLAAIEDILGDEYELDNVALVVRCKNCRYYRDAKLNKKGFLICLASGMEITEDDFCSYGELSEAAQKAREQE